MMRSGWVWVALATMAIGCEGEDPRPDGLASPLEAGAEMYAINSARDHQEVFVNHLSDGGTGLESITNGTKVRVVENWKDIAEETPPVKVLILEGHLKDRAGEVHRSDLVPVTSPPASP